MGDAFSDIARDNRRGKAVERYLEALFDHLTGNCTAYYLEEIAQECDSIGGGWGGRTSFTDDEHKKSVQELLDGNETAWLTLLKKLNDPKLFQKFKSISPLKGNLLLNVKWDYDDSELTGPDVNRLLTILNTSDERLRRKILFIIIPEDSLGIEMREIPREED